MADFRSWETLTSPELQRLADTRCVALLAMGATEQHGPHLPLGTDTMIARGLIDRARQHVDSPGTVLALPPLAIGKSSEHTSFPGTFTHEPETLLAMIRQIGSGLAASRVHRLVIVNAHGGQPQIVDLAAQDLRDRHAMLVVRANYMTWPLPPHLAGLDPEGHHGGMMETAIMLALHPDLVEMANAGTFRSAATSLASRHRRFGHGGRLGFAWRAEDLNPAGVVGRAGEATETLGEEFLDHFAQMLGELISDALDTDRREVFGSGH